MADAPKINPNESLRTSYPKINQSIDNANEALKKSITSETNSNAAVSTANEANEKSDFTQSQLDLVTGSSTIDPAVEQMKMDTNGVTHASPDARLRSDYEKITLEFSKNAEQIFWIKSPPPPLVGCKCDGVTDDSVAFKNLNNFLAANGGGTMRLPRSTKEITILNQEIDLNSNVEIEGYGWNSKIKCTVGSSGNGNNILKAFEKLNISISKCTIENMGFGQSGAWEPAGTFDGAGACVLAVGCENFVVDRVFAINGGGANGGEGVGNIYFSCCIDSKIINCTVKNCDNGICVDTWYNKVTGKENFVNDGVVISGNTISNGSGRGIVIECLSTLNTKGSIVVSNNTIRKMAYAGIQGNNPWNCIISGNTIEGDKTDRNYGNSNHFTWYGIEFVGNTKNCSITGNTFKRIEKDAIRIFEASDLDVSHNVIDDVLITAIFIKNVNNNMDNVKVESNTITNTNDGIILKRDSLDPVSLKQPSVNGNTILFNRGSGKTGIIVDYAEYAQINNNTIIPINPHGGCVGISAIGSNRYNLGGNIIKNCSIAYRLTNDQHSNVYGGNLENCTNAHRLDGCTNTVVKTKVRGGSVVFDMANGAVSTSAKCIGECDVSDTPTIKNGNGIIVKYRSSLKPTTNITDIGDRAENTSPTPGGYMGWVAVAQNSANWKGYGLIEAS